MEEEGGFDYRWVYGLERLSVKITSEGTNWWGQHVTEDILKDYTHQDRMGSTVNLSDQFGRVVGRADYNEWGEITYREALSISSSYRRIYPQLNYTGYDWDDVLGMYYAKARFYSADDKRFVAMDPIKGSVVAPLSLVSYLYCVDNPLRYVDPLGLELVGVNRVEFFLSSPSNFDIDASTMDVRYKNQELLVNLKDIMDAYGFKPGTGAGPNIYSNDKNVYLKFSDDRSQIFAASTSNYMRQKREENSMIPMLWNLPRYSTSMNPLLDPSYALTPLRRSMISEIDGTQYVNLDYFVKLMCSMGDSRSVDFPQWTISHYAISRAIEQYKLNDVQANMLLKANEYYRQNVELQNWTTVFAFEGAGAMFDEEGKKYGPWGDYHPYGQFNAMMVSVDQKGNILALSKNGSTLPDKPEKGKGTIFEGIYNLRDWMHETRSSNYAAATLNEAGKISSYKDKTDAFSWVINFHTAGISTEPNGWSEGCILVFEDDYIEFGIKTGFLTDDSNTFSQSGWGVIHTQLTEKYRKGFNGKIVIDRTVLYNLLIQDVEANKETLEFYFGSNWRAKE